MRKLPSILTAFLLATTLFGAANDLNLSQVKPGGIGNDGKQIPMENAITNGSLPSFHEAIDFGLTDTPNFAGLTLTNSSPTVSFPDGGGIVSAGSIDLTAGGTNEAIGILPSGTGGIGLGATAGTVTRLRLFGPSVTTVPVDATWYTSANAGLFLGYSEGTGSGAGDWVFSHASTSTNGTNQIYRVADGTLATPTAVQIGHVAGGFIGSFYDGAAFRNTAAIQFVASAAASSGVAPGVIAFATGETTGRVARIDIRANGGLRTGLTSHSTAAWGVTGIIQATQPSITFTDSSTAGSGTAATAVFSSFATPTLAASNTLVTTSVADTVYIANAPTAGTNQTITQGNALHVASGAVRFDGGIRGTATNDSASAGFVGEELKTTVASASAVSLTTNTQANLTSQSFTAGDWDVFVTVIRNFGATTSVTKMEVGISQSSATLPTVTTGAGDYAVHTQVASVPVGSISQTVGPFRVSLASTTTVYAVVRDTFTLSTDAVYGSIRGRRIR